MKNNIIFESNPELAHDFFEERAAIFEYDAGLPRDLAEELANRELNSPINFVHSSLSLVTLGQFLSSVIQPVEWIIPGILPEGLTILASRPKMGKSWLCLNLGLAVASGIRVFKKFDVQPQKVLYITFEDSKARLFGRLNSLMSTNIFNSTAVENNFVLTPELTIPFLDEEGMEFLLEIIKKEGIKLVIIDTFPRALKNYQSTKQTSYLGDYKMISPYQSFALKYHISLIFVYHTRKTISEDDYFVDEIQGTTGITAGADTLMVLKKVKENYLIQLIGKDVISEDIELTFDKKSGLWLIDSQENKIETTPEREEIINLLISEGREMRTSEIASKLGKKENNISTMLQKLVKENKIKNPKYGYYSIPNG
jgi:hypothetical protein